MDKRDVQAPIFNKLSEHAKQETIRFHVPGHKGGSFFLERAKPFFGKILDIDITEITGFDDLHHPEEMISKAQKMAATCFFSDRTYFLINGSTVGNMAMVLGSLRRGDQVLVQRNSHKSIFNALAIAEAEAIFLEPESCPTFNIPIGLSVSIIHQALKAFPNAKALILTYPNYYGMAFDYKEIIDLAHFHGLIVLVDEAHGAHFGQHKGLPESAMKLGADVSVQSTHKMLSSMTMTSMLHIQGNRVVYEDIEQYLRTLQSSSPSYPLMASLDLAREQVERMQPEAWENAIEEYVQVRRDISALGYVVSPTQEMKVSGQRVQMDPFKLTIAPAWDITGYTLQSILERSTIYCEMADPYNVLLTLPIIPMRHWNEQLVQVLSLIRNESYINNKNPSRRNPFSTRLKNRTITPIKMKLYRSNEKKEELLTQSIGKKAAEMILPYPPGVPLLVPGETITENEIEEIQLLQQNGAYFQGKNKGFKTIQVEI